MKKDKLYLIFSLAIIISSGAIIFNLRNSRSLPLNHPPISESQTQTSVMLLSRISELKKQLETDPGNFDLLVKLGNNYYDLNNPAESIKYYRRALEVRPDNPMVMVDCGTMYRELGEVDMAIEMFTKAAKLAPDLPQAFFNLGAVLLGEKGDARAAVEIWQTFLTKNPGIDPELKSFFEQQIAQALETK